MQPDDLVLFYGNGAVYAYGYVTAKVYWPGNRYVWPSGSGWDYMYALRDVTVIPAANRLPTMSLKATLTNFAAQRAQVHDLFSLGLTTDEALQKLFAVTGHVPGNKASVQSRPENLPPEARVPAKTLLR